MLSEPPPPQSRWKFQPRRWLDYRCKRFWALLLVLLYALTGFFLLPPMLKDRIVATAQQQLDRPVRLDAVRVNPLVFSVELRGVHIAEKDGAPLLGLDDLYVRLSPDSLLHGAWSFGTIRLDGLRADIVRYGPNDSNIGRLLQSIGPTNDPSKPAKDEAGTRLIVHHLVLQNAVATFTDHVPSTLFTTQIGPVTAQIDGFSTLPDKTGQQHIVIDLEKGATLEWSSQSSLDPLTSSGHVKAKGPYLPLIARYFGDAYKLAVPTGTLEAELDYHLEEKSGGDLAASVDHLSFALKDVAAQEKDAAAPFLTLPQLRLTGGHFSWPQREAGADDLSVEGLTMALRREPDGKIAPMPWAAPASPQAQAPAPQGKENWSLSLGKAEIKAARAQFEDHAIPDGGKIEITAIDLSAESLTNKAGAVFPFSLSMGVAPEGTAKLQGKATALPAIGLEAKLTLSDLPVALLQPYLADLAKLTIQDGKLVGEGDVTIKDPDGLKIAGQGEIRSLKLRDEVEQNPVLSWDSFGVDRYVYRQSAKELSISQATLTGPYLRFQVAKDHSNNFSHILVPATPSKQTAQAPAPAAPMKISIGKVTVASGSADYGDLSLPLPFATHITNLGGHISTLSSNASSASGVSLQGQVDQYGQANIYGQLNPFHATKGMKLNVVFRNVEFPGLSPYTVKFAGRRISKGRLDLESHYDVDGKTLTGSNRVVIRDMELGEKVDVPGAFDLPLDLLISLLKDDEGKIDLDIPITGDVSDPQFDFASVAAKEVADLLGDIVTSPFRALAGLLGGGGEALDHIDFAPGRAELEPPEKEKILHVADLLQKRPKVNLLVAGVIDQEIDRQKLQRDALDTEMTKELGDHDMVSGQRKFLEGMFEKRIGKDQLAAAKQPFAQAGDDDPAYIAALRRDVAKTEPVDEAVLAALAQSRGKAVADALRQTPGFDAQRISVGGSKEVKSDDGYHIPLKLEIASRS
jgi:uncharacterized protein involved in outer membrane biogenesis